jgi:3-isopropylmalate/(R)-2-methylmalate dehydratase small subunit
VIAVSFGDIFFGNCFQNSVLPIVLDFDALESLAAEAQGGDAMEVNLCSQILISPRGTAIPFTVNPSRRFQLLEGLDDLDLGLRRRDQVRLFQAEDRRVRPWIYELSTAQDLLSTRSDL